MRSEAGPEEKRASLSLSLRIDYALSLSVFDAFSEHNKQTPPRNLFSYVRGHLPVYASFSTFSLAFLFLFFSSAFRIPSLSHLRQWRAGPQTVRSYRYAPIERETYLSSGHVRTKAESREKNF